MAGKYKDEAGNKYGLLSALKFVGIHENSAWWFCQCDCGNVHTVKGSHLRSGLISSCGCSRKLDPGIAARNGLLYKYKQNAKLRGYGWQLSDKQFFDLTQQNCHYCGIIPMQRYWYKNCHGDYYYNGVDRLNNDIGYTKENSVPCCGLCNKAKRDLSDFKFLDLVNRIYEYQIFKSKSTKGDVTNMGKGE